MAGERRVPAVDVIASQKGWTLVADLPGCVKDDVSLTFAEGRLVLEGVPRAAELPEGASAGRRESPAAPFFRAIPLEGDLDADRATAKLDRGVLTVEVPRRVESAEHRIPVT